MKRQMEKLIGQAVALHTDKGWEVGILEKVSDQGVYLKPVPKQDRQQVDAEHVFWGGGYYPYGGWGYPGMGFGGVGVGAGIGVGVGFGAGFGAYRPMFW